MCGNKRNVLSLASKAKGVCVRELVETWSRGMEYL